MIYNNIFLLVYPLFCFYFAYVTVLQIFCLVPVHITIVFLCLWQGWGYPYHVRGPPFKKGSLALLGGCIGGQASLTEFVSATLGFCERYSRD